MKTLTTEQQTELQQLVEEISHLPYMTASQRGQLNYWSIELKAKRVRKKVVDLAV